MRSDPAHQLFYVPTSNQKICNDLLQIPRVPTLDRRKTLNDRKENPKITQNKIALDFSAKLKKQLADTVPHKIQAINFSEMLLFFKSAYYERAQ